MTLIHGPYTVFSGPSEESAETGFKFHEAGQTKPTLKLVVWQPREELRGLLVETAWAAQAICNAYVPETYASTPDASLSVAGLKAKYAFDSDPNNTKHHAIHRWDKWVSEVIEGHTHQGYWEWVKDQLSRAVG